MKIIEKFAIVKNTKIDSSTPYLLSGMCEARLANVTSAAQTPTILGVPLKSLPSPFSASDNCRTIQPISND